MYGQRRRGLGLQYTYRLVFIEHPPWRRCATHEVLSSSAAPSPKAHTYNRAFSSCWPLLHCRQRRRYSVLPGNTRRDEPPLLAAVPHSPAPPLASDGTGCVASGLGRW